MPFSSRTVASIGLGMFLRASHALPLADWIAMTVRLVTLRGAAATEKHNIDLV